MLRLRAYFDAAAFLSHAFIRRRDKKQFLQDDDAIAACRLHRWLCRLRGC